MTILITGANGYIARELINALEQDENVYIYAVVHTKHRGCFKDGSNIEYLYCDMDKYDTLWSVINLEVDCIVHCTWDGARGKRNHDDSVQSENILGTMKLLSSAQRLRCKRFIQMGSLAEYGMINDQKFPITEQTVCAPITPYAKAKYQCFLMLNDECSINNIEFCELRLGSVYGPDMQSSVLIQYIINSLFDDKEIELESDCEQRWEFVHVRDVIAILRKIIKAENVQGINVLNISTGENKRLRNFVEEIEKIIAGKGHINFGRAGNQTKFGCESIYCDVSLLKEYMGENYKFITFDDGVRKIINDHQRRREVNAIRDMHTYL